jgi:uncharacterized repeat protein (TIGR03837 family)
MRRNYPAPHPDNAPMHWDVFCRVIDNLGDAGVCWRLAANLAARGETVRLLIDDLAPLRRIAPAGVAGVEVREWNDALPFDGRTDVVCEAFGCDPPPGFVAQMARAAVPPCWINLEHLTAEAHAECSHGLPSPQLAGPGRGLTKWFYFPGFTAASGGLLREAGLLRERAAFDRDAWLRANVLPRAPGERIVVLFCYAHAGLDAWLDVLADEPTRLLVPQGPAQAAVQQLLGPALQRGALHAHLLPWLDQLDFDRLLWSADLNIVRGEDSIVRALWAGTPFVWQLYPQRHGAHLTKLKAFIDRWRGDAPPLPPAVDALLAWWNAGAPVAPPSLPPPRPPPAPWRDAVLRWRAQLAAQSDLVTRLIGFVLSKR